jgi:EAL domain-containing protein (putative c-di-GMP-specific phosphodiesterase class I)
LWLAYQPCVDASSEDVTGFEALIRWDHPEHGPVSPVEFIPLAEEIGLINEIGEWVLRTACAEAAKWPAHITVAVNLSPIQFKSHALPTIVRMVLGDTDLAAKRLELEITEGVFLSNDEHVHDMIHSLKAIGLINEIGEWVLRTACAEAAKWPSNVSVAVNLSPIQFKSPALPTMVRMILGETDLPAKRLELEITEGVFLSNDEHVHEMIGALKAIGVKLALDDFGTGYSSLSYLQRVPFDKIKIDRSFVTGASDPEGRNAALIRAMVGLASDLHMQTTAEGVETHEELALVRSLGCSLVQGYIFGKPMPAEEASALAAKGSAALPEQLPPREPRMRIIRATLLHYEGQVRGARLRNISSGGALVESREEVAVGAEIQLDFAAGGLIDAKVVWTKGTQFGCQFREKFNLKLLQPAKAAANPSTVVAPDYLTAKDAAGGK